MNDPFFALAFLATQAGCLGIIAYQLRLLRARLSDLNDMLLMGVMLPPASDGGMDQ